jgi:hypothetical protein
LISLLGSNPFETNQVEKRQRAFPLPFLCFKSYIFGAIVVVDPGDGAEKVQGEPRPPQSLCMLMKMMS